MANFEIIIANRSCNPSIIVLDKVIRENYKTVALELLAIENFQAEQVAFALDYASDQADGAIEMSGLEFCGNTARSYALYLAGKMGFTGEGTVRIAASGSEEILHVEVNTLTGYTKIEMPKPISYEVIECPLFPLIDDSKLLDFGGIMHLIINDTSADERTFERIKDFIFDNYRIPPAFGVMFYDTKFKTFVPAVYVSEIDTTYFEGSCASGTIAVAIALSNNKCDGIYHYSLRQPMEALDATVVKENGIVTKVFLEGHVRLSEPSSVEIKSI